MKKYLIAEIIVALAIIAGVFMFMEEDPITQFCGVLLTIGCTTLLCLILDNHAEYNNLNN